MTTRRSVSQCQRRLAVVWLFGAGILCAVFITQTMTGRFGTHRELAAEAWGWLIPTFMPTLSLMLGVLVADYLAGAEAGRRRADPFLGRLAEALSVAYLLVLMFTVLLAPFSSVDPIAPLKTARLWVEPIHGLVAAALGAFFVKGGAPEPAAKVS